MYFVYGYQQCCFIHADGINVNHTLDEEGWCWWYRKYAPGDTVLEVLERKRERPGKSCRPIRNRCHRGSGGSHLDSQFITCCESALDGIELMDVNREKGCLCRLNLNIKPLQLMAHF